MIPPVTVARYQLGEHLRSQLDVTVWDHFPEALTAPCVAISAGHDWLKPGPYFGATTFSLVAMAVVPMTTNQAATMAIEHLATKVVDAIVDHPAYQLDQVDAPYMLQTDQGTYLACQTTITITTTPTTRQEGDL